MKELLDLSKKTAIVTGASSGIGRATALVLAKAGADVVLAARRIEKLEEVAKEIEKMGQKALPIQTDVAKKEDVKRMVAETVKKFGKVDILVNNAAVLDFKNFLEIDDESWNKVLDVNLRGYFWAAQEVAKEMVKRRYGKIINITSIAGFAAFPQIGVYCVSKGGVNLLTKSMALELGPFNINVNAIAPGIIETEMTEGMLKDPKTKEMMLGKVPLARIGKPEDIANVVLFLASDLSSYLTGEIVVADGGWTAHL